jgi:hypothetical protein
VVASFIVMIVVRGLMSMLMRVGMLVRVTMVRVMGMRMVGFSL